MDTAAWLRGLSLPQYEQTFRDNAIDFAIVPELTDADLEKLGVLLGHRKILLKAIAALRPGDPIDATERALERRERAERRQLTVMFCDLVGSTALSTRLDPEDLRELLASYFTLVKDEIALHGGSIARYMGDGVLVYFGYPQAHEDDAERACRVGLALADRIAGLESGTGALAVRIGIATGVVVVGDLIGRGAAQERGAIGETLNLAARLQELAGPNSVLIDENTRRLLGHLFEFRDVGLAVLKGFSDKVRAWQVLRQSELQSRFEALRTTLLAPFVGREDELELLRRRWDRAIAGEGQIVLLSGEAGVGKSRIITTFSERLGSEPQLRLRFFSSPQYRDTPLFSVIVHLERAAGLTREDPAETKLDKLDALMAQAGINQVKTTGLFADLLSLAPGTRYPTLPQDPYQRREATLLAILEYMEGRARRSPVVIVVEDAHWLDSTSLDLLTLLIKRIPQLPVMLVVTFRPEFQAPWTGEPHVTAIVLSRLGRREAASLAQRVAADRILPEDILDQVIDRADGIPLFIEELIKTVLESGWVDEATELLRKRTLLLSAIPSSLQASLMARLDRLGRAKELAQIGAAIGREFSYELMSSLANRNETELTIELQQLVDAGVVFRRGEPPNSSYMFKHALIQDAAYSALLRSEREALHTRIGTVLEERFPETVATQPEILAQHFTQAGLAERAIGYWRKAGERALRRSAATEGVQHMLRAIELTGSLPPTPERHRSELHLHLALGRMIRIGKGIAAPETVKVFSRARQLLNENATIDEQVTVLYGLWGVHYVRGELAASREVAQQCLELAGGYGHDEAAAVGNYLIGASLWAEGSFIAARLHLERTLELCNAEGASGTTSRFYYGTTALAFLAWSLWPLGYTAQAAAGATEAIARAKRVGHVPLLAFALHCTAFLEAGFGCEQQPVTRVADDLFAFSSEHGLADYELWARFYQGIAITRRGDLQHGIEVIRAVITRADNIGVRGLRPLHLGHLATCYGRLGRPEIGIELIEDGLMISQETGAHLFDAELHRRYGELLLASGKTDDAAAALQKALNIAQTNAARVWELRAAVSLARLWSKHGQPAEACDLLAPVYAWFREGLEGPDLREAAALLAELRRGPRRTPGVRDLRVGFDSGLPPHSA